MKREIIILSTFALLWGAVDSVTGSMKQDAAAATFKKILCKAPAQKVTAQTTVAVPPLITENLVIFLGPDQKEYDALIAKDPDKEQGLIEWLSDYYHYAGQYIAPKLTELGIDVRSETWNAMRYKDAEGKEKTLIRKEFAGIVMYPKGKPPVLAYPIKGGEGNLTQIGEITFYPGPHKMAEVISKYFGVKIEWK